MLESIHSPRQPYMYGIMYVDTSHVQERIDNNLIKASYT